MEFNPSELHHRDIYKLMTGTIVPRPIAWVSTVSPDGVYNLAPFSYFTAVCPQPPLVVFCPTIRNTDGQEKDTLRNIRASGEYIINFVTESNAAAMNITSVETPATVDEIARAGLTTTPGAVVNVPRIVESPVHFECKLREIIDIGTHPGAGSLVLGEVVRFHIADDVYLGDFKTDHDKFQAVGRMAGMGYSTTRDRFDLQRPPAEIQPTQTPPSD